MAQPFKVRKTVLKFGLRKGEEVYSAQPHYYGTLTSKDMAKQIAQESSLTPADVAGVIDRMAYFCQTHCNLGYKVKIDGMGVFYNEFITEKTVTTPNEVTAKLVKSVRPAFSPEYNIVNGNFRYTMLPERIELVKVKLAPNEKSTSTEDEEPENGESENGTEVGDDDNGDENPTA